jgi:hypothetical protein
VTRKEKRPPPGIEWALRDFLLRVLVALGVATALLTEALSPFHLLRRTPLAVAWMTIALAACGLIYKRRPTLVKAVCRPLEAAIAVAIAGIAAIIGLTAILSPPNSADAMAYHLPRVVYWAQSGSVAFFPTPYLNQIMLQPLAEYIMLHTYVLSGGDHFINLVAWAAFLGCIMGVSAVAAAVGLGSRGQAFAALFCATLPNAILQASGAKNDMLLAFWMVAAVYFAARRDVPFTALSIGLALATKATAYLFLPGILVFQIAGLRRVGGGPLVRAKPDARTAGILLTGILLINAPQYLRNLRLSGSPLGYDSAQANGFFRWRNEHFGWKPTVSNALRHTSEQLGARSPRWNEAVYNGVTAIHRALNIDPQDPGATWRWARYQPPVNANHEANANNRWHLLLIVLAALFAAATGARAWTLFAAGLLLAFVLFCFYLKWQPFLARLELPLFILAAPLAAFLLQSICPVAVSIAICLFLVSGTRPALFENWTRPLKGPRSLFVTARDDNYFRDMVQWNNRASYLESVDRTARSGCATVGIDISENQLEYPFQALLRERNREVKFVHTGVGPDPPQPCAVLCPDCIGNRKKIAMYSSIGPPVAIGRFLLFLTQPRVILPPFP